jgi:hypothetical protein
MLCLPEGLRNLAYRKKLIPEFTPVLHSNIGPNTYYGHRPLIAVTEAVSYSTVK